MKDKVTVNPWLGEKVMRLRAAKPDAELRRRYDLARARGCREGWKDWLCEEALRLAVREDPSLLERREEMALPAGIRERLFMNQVMVLADLVQLTRETLEGIPGFTRAELDTLYAFLNGRGFPPRSSDNPVYMVFYPDVREEYDRVLERIRELVREAESTVNRGEGPYEDRLRVAAGLYEKALAVARENRIDLLNLETLVRKYVTLLTEHYQFGDEFRTKGEKYALLDVTLSEKVFGPRHSAAGKAHRTVGNFFFALNRYGEAIEHLQESASITKEVLGDYDAEAGGDLESIAYCYERKGLLQAALVNYLFAYEVSLRFPGNEFVSPKPLAYEISNIYRRMGDEARAKEYLEKAD